MSKEGDARPQQEGEESQPSSDQGGGGGDQPSEKPSPLDAEPADYGLSTHEDHGPRETRDQSDD